MNSHVFELLLLWLWLWLVGLLVRMNHIMAAAVLVDSADE
jgi:hypothetical protein